MVDDRWASLAIKAAANGQLNFKEWSRFDPTWYLKEKWTLDEVYRNTLLESRKMDFFLFVAKSIDSNIDAGTRSQINDDVIEIAKELPELAMPWLWKPERQRQASQSMADQWASVWGNPNEPETRAKIDKTVALLMEPMERRKKEAKRAAARKLERSSQPD